MRVSITGTGEVGSAIACGPRGEGERIPKNIRAQCGADRYARPGTTA